MDAAVDRLPYREIWMVDFEFRAPEGELPVVVCLVAKELRSGQTIRLWQDDLRGRSTAPYATGRDALFVAYMASAEFSCHLALGWPLPENVLDLYVEFSNRTNGLLVDGQGRSLLQALRYFGLDGIDAHEKEDMRELAMRGGPWTAEERRALLAYCESDVTALERLLPRLLPQVDVPRALLRGRYMKAVARIERAGIPIDVHNLDRLRRRWDCIKTRLVQEVDADYGVFDGTTFKADRWAAWLAARGIPWPLLPSGALALDNDTFREMAKVYPIIGPVRDLRHALSQLRLTDLPVGLDARNRCLLSPFRAATSRNAPSTTRFIFGPAVWLRSLIQPTPGCALAYIDYSQQEFGIAAALSGDPAMIAAYLSGDPYLGFAKQAGAVPPDATKKSHEAVRDKFKACVLGVQYCMGAESLALRIGQPVPYARELLRLHRQTYPRYWEWSEAAVSTGMLFGALSTTFGWTLHVTGNTSPRTLANFPMQANGAEMLRIACSLATEAGVVVCAPVHDALLIEAPERDLDWAVSTTKDAMAVASEIVLAGRLRLRSDVKITHHPDRYMDGRGKEMWTRVVRLLDEADPPLHAAGAPVVHS